MSQLVWVILSVLGGIVFGGGVVYLFKRNQELNKKKSARVEADRILNRARSEVQKIQREAQKRAKDFEVRARRNAESEIQKNKQKLRASESQLQEKMRSLEKKLKNQLEGVERKANEFEEREEKIRISEKRLSDLEDKSQNQLRDLTSRLEQVSNMTTDQARQELIETLREDSIEEAKKEAVKIEEKTKAEAEKKARNIISVAIARYASEVSSERTVSVVSLPSDEMKGKIIGREGRNIRTLESLCGVDLIVDDTPEAVVISGFDPVRREVAKRTLERLMEDGRVHPARIEEISTKVKAEVDKNFKEEGEKACFELGIHGMHPALVKLVGSLKYRQSLTQNSYIHSVEVGFIAGLLASEIGANAKQAKRAGLLHEIGKSIEHTIEGSYSAAGAEFARKHGESEAICQAIRAVENEVEPKSIVAHLVQAADALSTARPGARRSMMGNYIQRLEDLESIGNSFEGVIRTFAVQAGREVRVIVEGSRVTDDQASMLSRDIARKIERELAYPGNIKVSVVREIRAVEHAR